MIMGWADLCDSVPVSFRKCSQISVLENQSKQARTCRKSLSMCASRRLPPAKPPGAFQTAVLGSVSRGGAGQPPGGKWGSGISGAWAVEDAATPPAAKQPVTVAGRSVLQGVSVNPRGGGKECLLNRCLQKFPEPCCSTFLCGPRLSGVAECRGGGAPRRAEPRGEGGGSGLPSGGVRDEPCSWRALMAFRSRAFGGGGGDRFQAASG